ncbi:MAG: response regulator transcription factor [Chloroflexota bacterium]
MAANVRIILADDHAILRSGLRMLLSNETDFEIVGEASSGAEAIEKVKALQPDVLMLDLNMPGGDGLSVIPQIKTGSPETRVLILTMHDDVSYLQQAIKAGASGYILKKAVDTELLLAIRAVIRGEIYVHSAMTQKLLGGSSTPLAGQADPWQTLSEREYAVLKRVALGYTNAEIAEELFLSPKTVESYRARGMEKLKAQTRAQLVKSALKYGHLD